MMATPSNVWVAVSTNSSTWRASRARATSPPPRKCATGSEPTSRLHWFTLEAMRVAIAAAPEPRRANMTAMMNSGDSEASGASHCTRK